MVVFLPGYNWAGCWVWCGVALLGCGGGYSPSRLSAASRPNSARVIRRWTAMASTPKIRPISTMQITVAENRWWRWVLSWRWAVITDVSMRWALIVCGFTAHSFRMGGRDAGVRAKEPVAVGGGQRRGGAEPRR